MYQEVMQELYSLWTVTVRERDEASERLQNSLADLSKIQKIFNNILLSEEQQQLPHYYYQEATEETNRDQNCNNSHFLGDSQFQFSLASSLDIVSNPVCISSPAISDSGSYSSSSNQMSFDVQKIRDYETVVLEFIGGVLPENGKFLQAVTKATGLVELQLITGQVPKWKNPPVQMLGQRPVLDKNFFGHSNTGKWISGGLELGSGMLNRSFPCKKARFSLMS